MKYCQNCGSQLNDTAAFCTRCGTRWSEIRNTTDNKTNEFNSTQLINDLKELNEAIQNYDACANLKYKFPNAEAYAAGTTPLPKYYEYQTVQGPYDVQKLMKIAVLLAGLAFLGLIMMVIGININSEVLAYLGGLLFLTVVPSIILFVKIPGRKRLNQENKEKEGYIYSHNKDVEYLNKQIADDYNKALAEKAQEYPELIRKINELSESSKAIMEKHSGLIDQKDYQYIENIIPILQEGRANDIPHAISKYRVERDIAKEQAEQKARMEARQQKVLLSLAIAYSVGSLAKSATSSTVHALQKSTGVHISSGNPGKANVHGYQMPAACSFCSHVKYCTYWTRDGIPCGHPK